MAVAGEFPSVIAIYRNAGDETFPLLRNFGVGQSPVALAVGDLNLDSRPDLISSSSEVDTISVLRTVPNGGFLQAPQFPAGLEPVGLVTADFKRDGKPDLAASNENSDNVSILLGTGLGSFSRGPAVGTANFPIGLVAADFNNDQIPDLAVATNGDCPNDPGGVSIRISNGDGTFESKGDIRSGGTNPSPITAADFNHDGFQAPFESGVIMPQVIQVAAADFNNDEIPDLLACGAGAYTLALGVGNGQFQTPRLILIRLLLDRAALADLNGDGNMDIAAIDFASNTVASLLGNGDGTFRRAGDFLVRGQLLQGITAADVNGDGRLDVALAGLNSHTVTVLLGNGGGAFGPSILFGTGVFAQSPVAADFNGDSKMDLAVTGRIGVAGTVGAVSVLLNTTR